MEEGCRCFLWAWEDLSLFLSASHVAVHCLGIIWLAVYSAPQWETKLEAITDWGRFFFFLFLWLFRQVFFLFFRTAFCLISAYRLRTNCPLQQDSHIFIRFKFDYFHHVWSAVKALASQRWKCSHKPSSMTPCLGSICVLYLWLDLRELDDQWFPGAAPLLLTAHSGTGQTWRTKFTCLGMWQSLGLNTTPAHIFLAHMISKYYHMSKRKLRPTSRRWLGSMGFR